MKTDENYPNIGIEIKIGIIESDKGFNWNVLVHVQGPDDYLDFASDEFESKKQCNLDMLEKALPKAMDMLASFE